MLIATKFKEAILFWLSVAAVSFIIIFIVSIYFGANPLNHNQLLRYKIVSVFPQGWAFFTRNSAEPRVYGFYFNPRTKKFDEINQRNMSLGDDFGLDRSIRLLNSELMYYANIAVEKGKYIIHDRCSNVDQCVNGTLCKYISIKYNCSRTPFLHTGKYLIIIQKMLPWPLLSKQPNYPSNFDIIPIYIN